MATINKKYLQQQLLLQDDKLTPEQAFYLVRDFFAIISEALERGEDVKVSSFGCFKLRQKNARPGRDILRKKTVLVSARRVVTFTPTKRLAEDIQNNAEVLKTRIHTKGGVPS